MDPGQSSEQSRVAPELYFLLAKFLSNGPLKETNEVLRRELEKCKILPKRLDWEGNPHEQTFEELEIQYPNVSEDHLLSVCTALLKTGADEPKRSLLCCSLFSTGVRRNKYRNVLDRMLSRHAGGSCSRLLPSAVYGSLQLQRRTLGHLSAVYCVLFDRTGRYIVTGADDLLVKIWSAIDGRLLGTLRGASAEITDMAVDTDNHLLAAGSLDRLVRVWDMQTAAPVAVLQGHNGMITSVHFCPARSGDLSCLVSTSTDGSVAFWTYSHSNGGKPCFISKPVQYVERMRPGACQMICGAWSPGGAFLAAGSADHHVRVYMMAENGPKRILETAAHCEAVDSLQWAHTGLRFVSGSKDGTAILWTLHAMQWRHVKLNMSDTLPGEKVESDEKKMKVTMVGWDCTDSYVITAVNDYTLKVWCSSSGKLVRVLRGHTDEIYVLEAHPKHPAVLLSAGHDGQIFIWDILKGISLGSFQNHIDGQGHGAVFDAKWSPDGSKVAATDSHGHIIMLGLGRGHPLLQTLPTELFFHTDYRPLVRDALGGVCDEQTGAPPHLMPPPFLVDVEGAPHSPRLQRLVPGREHATMDQLVPDNSAGEMLMQDGEEPRSHIDYMIEALARQYNYRGQFELPGYDGPLRMALRTEGVRHSAGEWQRGDPLVRSRRAMVQPLSQAESLHRRLYTEEMTALEMAWYRREMRRRPVMICTAAAGSMGQAEGARGRRGGPRAPVRRPAPSTRVYSEPPEDASSHHSDSDSSVRMSVTEYSASNSSSSDNHFENHSGGSSSSDYSDWVADQPNVPLRPPKRSKRKPIAKQKFSPHPPTRKSAARAPPSPSSATSPASPAGQADDGGEGEGPAPPPVEVPEAYPPSDWLCAVQPRKAPYHPQMGDECVYFKQGHSRYLDAVTDKDVYKVNVRDKPWERFNLNECESVKIVGIKYMIRPPRLVCLKLLLDNGTHFTVRYHDMPDVLDFLVLRQTYLTAEERQWAPGDRFRCMIDDGWWTGCVVEGGGGATGGGAEQFLSLRVRWDNGEYERMSPWDLEPIDDTRLPTEVGGWVSVLPAELEAVLYHPRREEWPGGDRASACQMIASGLDQVMLLAIAEPFVAPVDLNVYPNYARIVEYPIDLSTVKARFENHFYRRVTSAQFDVRYLATNAEKFNVAHSHIIKQARIITDLCLQVISDPFEIDVQGAYHSLVDSYQSSDSDIPLAKQSTSLGKVSTRDWVSRCRRVLSGLFAASDSVPFRESVPIDQLPEYTQVVARPMDLGMVRERLEAAHYSSPSHFAREVRLVFSNSKTYNTNKRSRIFAMTLRLETLFETLYRPVHRHWKAARRRNGAKASDSSEDSPSEDEDRGGPSSRRSMQNGHHSAATASGNGFATHDNGDDDDSWDSDAPLRGAPATPYKGKGKGKRSQPTPPAPPTRTSQRRSAAVTPLKRDPWAEQGPNGHGGAGSGDSDAAYNGGGRVTDESAPSHKGATDDDSGDSYKPSRSKQEGRRKKKGKRKREIKSRRRSGKSKHSNRRRPKAKRRKRGSGANSTAGSSSDTAVSVASNGSAKRRYESDHSFQLREPSPSESDSDTPLGNIRRVETSRSGNDAPSTSSQVRSGRFNMHSDESRAGPSGSSGRARRPARDNSKRPRYNEDSEEDSIAAISKRLRAHQRPRANPITVQSRLSTPSAQARPPAQAPQPSWGDDPGSDERTLAPPAPRAPSPVPLSVSSRGRVRRLTPKARGLLGD